MELMVRGVNFLVPHGMWYNPDLVKIPPLIAHYSKILGPALHPYSDYVGRSVALLQDGNRVADIALLYPIESLESWYEFDNPTRPTTGKDVPLGMDYNRISDMLTGQIRQDFTFVHPEELATDKYQVNDGELYLLNSITHQQYKLLIMPSAQVLSVEAMKKIKAYYQAGGKILATHQLPGKSAEFGKDKELVALIQEVFGIDPHETMPNKRVLNSNEKGGRAMFIPLAEKDVLADAVRALLPNPDVLISVVDKLDQPDALHRPLLGVEEYRDLPAEKLGMFSYIHKQKNGKDIYFFANSTDYPIKTNVELRGKLELEDWNPYTGSVSKKANVKYKEKNGIIYTEFTLELSSVNSTFVVGSSIKE